MIAPKLFSQENIENATSQKTNDKNKIVYWFNVNLDIKKHRKFGNKYYIAKNTDNRIRNGSLKKYDKVLWRQLSNGPKFAVGPFDDWNAANQAKDFYRRRVNFYKDVEKQDSIFTHKIKKSKIHAKKEVFWFYLSVEKRPRSGSLEVKRIPAAIFPSTYESFITAYSTGLQMQKLAIGPFWHLIEAENAKRRYRLQ